MLSEFLLHFLSMKRKKGYQILGKKYNIILGSLMVYTTALSITLVYTQHWINYSMLWIGLLSFIVFYKFSEIKIIHAAEQYQFKIRQTVKSWLSTRGFNHSSQYENFSNLLLEEAKGRKKDVSISTYLIFVLPLWGVLASTLLNEDITMISILVMIAFLGTLFSIIFKIILDEYLNAKYNHIVTLTKIVSELGIELSIKENR